MNPRTLTQWSIWSGGIGVLAYVVAVIMLWQGADTLLFDKLDHKDLYYAGQGLVLLAIWMKLGAIYHKGS